MLHELDSVGVLLLRRTLVALAMLTASFSIASGQEEAETKKPPAEAKQIEAAAEEEEEAEPLTRQVVNNMLRKGQLKELAERIDEALAVDPMKAEVMGFNTQLCRMWMRSDEQVALKRLKLQWEKLIESDSTNSRLAYTLMDSARSVVLTSDDLTLEEKLASLDQTSERLDQFAQGSSPLQSQLLQTKVMLYMQAERSEEAKELLDAMLADNRKKLKKKQLTSNSFASFASMYNTYMSSEYPEDAKEVVQEVKGILLTALEGDSPNLRDFSAYQSLASSEVRGLTYSDPEAAGKAIGELTAQLQAFKEKCSEEDLKRLASYERTIKSYQSRIDSALAQLALIGTPAPEIDAEFFVASDELTMADLKGKVVLLDFWAVWCGPCIATFPHLIEWHEEYADKGLVILGATKFYGYEWNEEAKRASRSKEEVAPEQELEMLERFREHHGLHHGFFVSPKGSEYSKQFLVSGIPQAVLIDQEGNIAMIKVGSGEANAKALHEKIEELLQ